MGAEMKRRGRNREGLQGGGASREEYEGISQRPPVALTGLHRPHRLSTDVSSWTTLDGLHLVRSASVIRLLHAAVALQGLRSCGCGPGRTEGSLLKISPPHRESLL